MRTKLEILTARAAEMRAEVEKLEREIAGLARTPFSGKCSGCGERLETEAAFAGHFVVPNERYLNLGECPVNPRKR